MNSFRRYGYEMLPEGIEFEIVGDDIFPEGNFGTEIYVNEGKVPHRCPVCKGRGSVDSEFYNPHQTGTYTTDGLRSEVCRTCGGSGIVWG